MEIVGGREGRAKGGSKHKQSGFHPEKKFLGEKWAWQFHAP